jgi:membrane-bound lytic murein transglycosylase A
LKRFQIKTRKKLNSNWSTVYNHNRFFRFILSAILAAFCFSACAPVPAPVPSLPEAALKQLEISDYPDFIDDNGYDQLAQSIAMSLDYLRQLPQDRQILFGADPYSVAHLMRSLAFFDRIIRNQPAPEELNRAIRTNFRVYQSIGRQKEKDVLFTGYYEPMLHGSVLPDPRFPIPVHTRPADLVEIDLGAFAADLKGRTIVGKYTGRSVIPYPTRSGIRQQAEFNRIAPPVVWLEDEIDLFILQIQGSGRIVLDNGEQFNILYDGSNGRPYQSIGRLLIDQGRIPADKMSMQAIRSYLQDNPQVAQSVMDHNPRYIFFKRALQGPLGALGRLLTPKRSLAVDRSMLPSAALAFITLPLPRVDPSGNIEKWAPYRGFALAQDAGSAIKGPGRIDLFMGHGRQAEAAASHLKHSGAIYFLVLNPETTP